MSLAPIPMLEKCREQFRRYAAHHREKACDVMLSTKDRNLAINKAKVNEDLAQQITETLRDFG